MSEKLEELISLLYQDRLTQCGKRLLVENIEKLQKENEELKNEVMEKDLEIIGKEEYTKASMKEIIEQYYTANEECIPVQKVKDKIEEIKKEKNKFGNCLVEFYENELADRDIKILQELLEGRKENESN